MPMWWVMIFLFTLLIFFSVMSMMSEEMIYFGKEGKLTSPSISSWWWRN